jgi:hypothetical protein
MIFIEGVQRGKGVWGDGKGLRPGIKVCVLNMGFLNLDENRVSKVLKMYFQQVFTKTRC